MAGPTSGWEHTSVGATWQSHSVMNAMSTWRSALMRLPMVQAGRWAVSGSAALSLHGRAVDPQDLDLVADAAGATELVDGLGDLVRKDVAPWDRGAVSYTHLRAHETVLDI